MGSGWSSKKRQEAKLELLRNRGIVLDIQNQEDHRHNQLLDSKLAEKRELLDEEKYCVANSDDEPPFDGKILPSDADEVIEMRQDKFETESEPKLAPTLGSPR